jgi:hypothetical protein
MTEQDSSRTFKEATLSTTPGGNLKVWEKQTTKDLKKKFKENEEVYLHANATGNNRKKHLGASLLWAIQSSQ